MQYRRTIKVVTAKQFDTKNSPVNHVFGSDLKLQLRLARRQMQYRSEAELTALKPIIPLFAWCNDIKKQTDCI